VRARYGNQTTPADVAAGKAAIAYWVAFAKQGDPNTAGLPRWPQVTATGSELLDFSNRGPQPGMDPWQPRLDVVEAASPAH
jgi:para-nitrobenzyl esterase